MSVFCCAKPNPAGMLTYAARVAPVLKKAIQDGSIKLTAIVNTHQ